PPAVKIKIAADEHTRQTARTADHHRVHQRHRCDTARMDTAAWNLALVLLFVLVGGYFAAAEIALVSLRDSQVRRLAERSRRGKRVAQLREDSNRFLSAVQIGVTFAGFFASSYGGATIAVRIEPVFTGWGLPAGLAAT